MHEPQGPFVVTEDLPCLLAHWARTRGFKPPPPAVFTELRERLRRDILECLRSQGVVDPKLLYLEHRGLLQRAARALSERYSTIPLVTLDRLYFPTIDRVVDVTRLVIKSDKGWKTLPGLGVRVGEHSLDEQIARVIRSLPEGVRDVRVVDDGLWSGTTSLTVTNAFKDHGVTVQEILVALMVESMDSLERLAAKGHPDIHTLVTKFLLSEGGVIDWVCERDFYPGVPLGGRTVQHSLANGRDTGAYYIDPVGDESLGSPSKWASLSCDTRVFSYRRIEDAVQLFEGIELASGRRVLWQDLDRVPYGFSAAPDEPFVEVLKNYLKRFGRSAVPLRTA